MDVCLGAHNEDSSSALLSLAANSRAFDHESPSGAAAVWLEAPRFHVLTHYH